MKKVFKHIPVSCKERNNLFSMLTGAILRSRGFKSQIGRFKFGRRGNRTT